VAVLRVHEVALKGRKRRWFMHLLTGNVAFALRGAPYRSLRIRNGRVLVGLSDRSDWDAMRPRLERVFGVENFSLSYETSTGIEAMQAGAAELLDAEGPPRGSFRVHVKRSDKTYPLPSPEVERLIGGFVKERTGAEVRLRGADQIYQVEILPNAAYVTSAVLPGPGGLQVGASGRLVGLHSGGNDSPVAMHRMMSRGCAMTLVHCHAYPFVRPTSIEKVIEIARHLGAHRPGIELCVVPIGEAQRQIAVDAAPRLRVVLYRRLMLRLAEAIAERAGARAIVTGESLGQVASQTLENLRTIEDAVALPVFRPLIGMDKQEILEQAKRIGTEPISRVPDDDCCTVFLPRNPATHSTPEEVAEAERGLDIAAMVDDCLAQLTRFRGDPDEWELAQALDAPGQPDNLRLGAQGRV
jgi:thiamine biosynthesis protein ThiI